MFVPVFLDSFSLDISFHLFFLNRQWFCHCKRPSDASLGYSDQYLNWMLNEECLKRTCPCGELCSNQQVSRYSLIASRLLSDLDSSCFKMYPRGSILLTPVAWLQLALFSCSSAKCMIFCHVLCWRFEDVVSSKLHAFDHRIVSSKSHKQHVCISEFELCILAPLPHTFFVMFVQTATLLVVLT